MNRRTAPDAGEDYTSLAKTFPAAPASAGIVFDGDEGRLSEAVFLRRRRRPSMRSKSRSRRLCSRARPRMRPGGRRSMLKANAADVEKDVAAAGARRRLTA